MPTLAEIWTEEGRQEGILLCEQEMVIDALDAKFGSVSDSLMEKIKSVENTDQLKFLLRRVISVQSLQEFEEKI